MDPRMGHGVMVDIYFKFLQISQQVCNIFPQTTCPNIICPKKLFFPLSRIGHLLRVLCSSKSVQKSSWLVAKPLDGSQQILRQVEDPKFEQHLLSIGPTIPPPRFASLCDNSKNRGVNITWWIGSSWDFDPSKSRQLFSLSLYSVYALEVVF